MKKFTIDPPKNIGGMRYPGTKGSTASLGILLALLGGLYVLATKFLGTEPKPETEPKKE